MTTEIKPCPFCGGNYIKLKTRYVRCGECNSLGPDASSPAEAVERWNAAPRHDDVPVAVAVEQETLHDKYTMAALTGLLAYSVNEMPNGNYHSNCSVEGCIADARKYADAAMKARGT